MGLELHVWPPGAVKGLTETVLMLLRVTDGQLTSRVQAELEVAAADYLSVDVATSEVADLLSEVLAQTAVLTAIAASTATIRTLRAERVSKASAPSQASLSQTVSLFKTPLLKAARAIEALRAKAEADPSVLAGGAG